MPSAVATSTIRDVELVSVGEWPASTGATRVTRAHLEACLAAAQDNDVDQAPIRIGHVDPRFDGEPALGWVRPTRIVDTRRDGRKVDTLVGDIVGIPSRLSEVAPTAFRRRSVELAWDVVTPAGKSYPVVLAGLALLGVAAPAVKGLSDVLALFAEDTTRTAPHRPSSPAHRLEIVDGLEDNPSAVAMLAAARDNGATVEQLDAMATAAGARDTTPLPQPTPDPPHDGPEPPPANRGEPMPRNRTLTDAELRRLLEQESDVDVEATLAGIRDTSSSGDPDPNAPTDPNNPPNPSDPAPADPHNPTPPSNPSEPSNPTPPAGSDPARPSPAPDPNNPGTGSHEPELVTMSAGQWQQVQRDVEWARNRRRDEVLDGAIREGRIAPAERSAFAAQLERDEDGTTRLLSTLAAGRIPTHERGLDHAPTTEPSAEDWQAFEESIGAGAPPQQ